MSRLDQLYQDMILEHNKNPRQFGVPASASHASHGVNPLCGDDYWVYLNVDEHAVIQDVHFHGTGCAISKSSGSMMSQAVKGRPVSEVLEMKEAFIGMLTSKTEDPSFKEKVGKLKLFEGVKKFPVRVKCATLVWRALEDALQTHSGNATTE